MRWIEPSPLDRSALTRSVEHADRDWAGAVVVEIDAAGSIAASDGVPRPVVNPGPRRPEDVLLGRVGGRQWYARPVPSIEGERISWREVQADVEALAAGVALTRWHLNAPRCERCGGPTQPDLLGARRVCTGCGSLLFARTDPCVIVAITDPSGRLLLARQAAWPEGRRSIIAGFLEAGESAEQACHREVMEEVGVPLSSLSYVSSQPWPMPRSLMLGFRAGTAVDEVRVDGVEIVEGGFYTRREVLDAVGAGRLTLPSRVSIAHDLISAWLDGR